MKHSNLSKLLVVFLSLTLCFGILPGAVFAADGENAANVNYGIYDENGEWTPIDGDSTQYTTANGIDLTLRKLLTPTDNEDEFEITLQAEASATVEITSVVVKDAAVCLVLDESGSMGNDVYDADNNRIGTRTDVLKSVAKDFVNDFRSGEEGVKRLVSVVGFDSRSRPHSSWVDVNTDDGYNAILAAIDTLSDYGTTYMYTGLDTANTLLEDVPAGCASFVVAMTDGVDFDTSRALSSADTIKAGGAVIYTVGIGLSSSYRSFLENVASSPDKCFTADNFTGLGDIFTVIGTDISASISALVRNATVTDPMAPAISVISNGNPRNFTSTDDTNYTWRLVSTTPAVDDNGTTVTYTYFFETTYTVKIDREAEEYADNTYHVTNEITQLVWSRTEDEEGNIIEERYQFPVPSFDLTEENEWHPPVERKPLILLPQPGVAILHVTDAETGEPISGLRYNLYRFNPYGGKDTKVGETHTTRADGTITIGNTTTDYYYWLAAEDAAGYVPDNNKHTFRVIGLQFVTTEVALTSAVSVPAAAVVEEPAIAEKTEEATVSAAAALPFTDAADNADIAFVYENGIMNGVSDTLFAPESPLTRGMIVTILYRMENEPAAAFAGTFTDVADGEWYSAAIEWAADNSIVNGYTDGTFGPNDNVTREQLAAILYRYAAMKGYSTEAEADIEPMAGTSDYALAAMKWALTVGIISPELVPTLPATRGEVAAAIHVFAVSVAD